MKTFAANLRSLYHMLAFIRNEIAKCGFDSFSQHRIEVAVEEVIVNIICYAYENQETPSNEKKITLSCAALENQRGVEISIQQEGAPYNPLENDYLHHSTLSEDDIANLGIFLVVNLMDEVFYHRKNMTNTLVLIKYLV